ncbi:homodimeric glycerol 3-phosphate dehydrogenase (quinone) [Aliiroseovarius halocynthiae]|uniref:Glycerol-3-phosphate dehydrogenase n=1 Tax=Aliiroseovarius halocynthiae TaxID=985055 RepID=A0A545SP90_9RHOB|nr:glycerol-3-phosphate dehydrogenase [Aliiroseovarius halocynthiae]TQV66764.1 glycerol-3-phosphate dehydrogenase [Aliiroseovarius halocynthiae]SMR82409.1 homodimeric glycerol 3-phosphate dehydrogenase (quinone) [Aliiroseovarius halocynthiae]
MQSDFDLLIIGGGINGCGIARDAAGRGLSVCLAEMGDIGGATSSASTKLFHGGLRYLEYFEVRLVREALKERETLLRAMPHISWPMRFVLPYHHSMRFDSSTPTSRLLNTVMPWMKGRRPGWLVRLGLFLYDNLGGRKILPGTTRVDLTSAPEGQPLNPMFETAFEYSDCWVEDARLVVLNARDAEARGAEINPRTKVTLAEPYDGGWRATLTDTKSGEARQVTARMLVNAAGPWVAETLGQTLGSNAPANIRLVRGSHIVTKRLFDHDKCYFFQGQDGRIIFAIPYETDFTLIGTTDADHEDPDTPPRCSDEERDYLVTFINGYLKDPIAANDVVWTYSGVRPLYNDGGGSAAAATRDYVLRNDTVRDAPVLNIFGGKITTYRRLAESALEKIGAVLGPQPDKWTAGVPLPGGDFPVDGFDGLVGDVLRDFPFLSPRHAKRLVRAYGTEARDILGDAKSLGDLGQDFGATLTEAELRWLMDKEYAQRAEDVVWRRSKLGLLLDADQLAAIDTWMRIAR